MASTLSATNLTITLTEQLTSNGQVLNYTNQSVIANIKPFDPRVMTIPITEVEIIDFAAQVAQGTFITENLRYLRVTNKDDTNWLRVRLKRVVNGTIGTLAVSNYGSGYKAGTYTGIALTGGTGSGATATFVVTASGVLTKGTITPGTGYVNATYTTVPLTGGTGTGAQATITVAGTAVTAVTITTPGTGYAVNDVLSASNTNLGGTGSGFSVPVTAIGGAFNTVTLVNVGEGYTLGDNLSVTNTNVGGIGSGFIAGVTDANDIVNIFDKKVDAGGFFVIDSTGFSVSDTDTAFSSFVDIQSISAQADTAPIDIEYFVASIA